MEKHEQYLVKDMSKKLGLPEEEMLEKIQGMEYYDQQKAILDLIEKNIAIEYGLSADATREKIESVEKEITRNLALSLGLPEDATDDEVREYVDEQERKKEAKELGLSENATWDDILKKSGFYIEPYEKFLEKKVDSPKKR